MVISFVMESELACGLSSLIFHMLDDSFGLPNIFAQHCVQILSGDWVSLILNYSVLAFCEILKSSLKTIWAGWKEEFVLEKILVGITVLIMEVGLEFTDVHLVTRSSFAL